jgi:hypothetical protein
MVSFSAFASINYYQKIFIPFYTKKGELRIAIRQFLSNKNVYFLVVDPYQYVTSIVKADQLYPRNPAKDSDREPGYFAWEKIKETPYIKDLLHFTAYPGYLENAGLTHAIKKTKGFFLTVDMCPSIKPIEKDFFRQLVAVGKNRKIPFPVAIAMSGLWMLNHMREFTWLLQMQKENKLNITWVNHSFSHMYFKDLPSGKNFLLFFQTDLENEILTTELLLLNHKQLPSVFVRFPGLIADKPVMQTMQHCGLIPLGSDAWLDRDQHPKDGSIILVHGNGNEPIGIEKAMVYLKNTHIIWLPIEKALH